LSHEKFFAPGWPVGPRALIVFQVAGCTCPTRPSTHTFSVPPSITMRDKWQKWKIRSFAFDPLGSLLPPLFAVRAGSYISGLLSFNLAQKSLLALPTMSFFFSSLAIAVFAFAWHSFVGQRT